MLYDLYDVILHDVVSTSNNIASEFGWFVKDYSVIIWKETVVV
jgi:hypothetical protein